MSRVDISLGTQNQNHMAHRHRPRPCRLAAGKPRNRRPNSSRPRRVLTRSSFIARSITHQDAAAAQTVTSYDHPARGRSQNNRATGSFVQFAYGSGKDLTK